MFRTKIEQKTSDIQLNHNQSIISIGSCFSDNIGERLKAHKFKISINPYGTVFNPLSIFKLLECAISGEHLSETSLLKRDGQYLSYDLHSDFKATTAKALQHQFHQINQQTKKDLQKCSLLVITFGTSWIYEKKRGKDLVSNCHKVPQKEFDKRLLNLDEILSSFFELETKLEEINPELNILLTVSPIRHTRSGIVNNSKSKSNLILACHYIQKMAKNVHYYPSYEIMLDDLRDYRFYEKDMVHPNELAIDYIWDHFSDTFFNSKTKKLNTQIEKAQRSVAHRAFNPNSAQHQKFLSRTLNELHELNKKVSFQKEIDFIKSQIINE